MVGLIILIQILLHLYFESWNHDARTRYYYMHHVEIVENGGATRLLAVMMTLLGNSLIILIHLVLHSL